MLFGCMLPCVHACSCVHGVFMCARWCACMRGVRTCVVYGVTKWMYCMVHYLEPTSKSSTLFVANDGCATTL